MILLGDLFEFISMNQNVIVLSLNGDTLDIYDGKNSIDEGYNDVPVVEIFAISKNEISIMVDIFMDTFTD